LKLEINDKNGLIHAIQSYNLALIERVGELALRIEGHVFKQKYVDKLKDELENKCLEY
jgi:hypothetical protein